MSEPLINCHQHVSNEAIIAAYTNLASFDAKEKSLKEALQALQMERAIGEEVSHIKNGVPIKYERFNYENKGIITQIFCNVTPSKEQKLKERKVVIDCSNNSKFGRLKFFQDSPWDEHLSLLVNIQDFEAIQEIAFEFIVTGKFPQPNQLKCKLNKEPII